MDRPAAIPWALPFRRGGPRGPGVGSFPGFRLPRARIDVGPACGYSGCPMNLLLAAVLAAQDPAYETTFLETGTLTHHIEARDLNGDGKPDLIIQNGRALQIFLQNGGKYTTKPQQ